MVERIDSQQVEELVEGISSQVSQQVIAEIRKICPEPAQEQEERERSYRYQAKRYGFGYDLIEVECTINTDGSAEVRRTVKIIAYSEISELDGYLTLADAPAGAENEIDYVNIRSLDDKHNVSKSRVLPGKSQNSVLLTISPPLKQLESTEYELIERASANFYGQDEEDLFGWSINRPIRKLSMRVYFPQNVKPDRYSSQVYAAAVAPGIDVRREHHEEQKRLQGPFRVGPEGGRYHLKLNVDYPMTGMIYVIRWSRPVTV